MFPDKYTKNYSVSTGYRSRKQSEKLAKKRALKSAKNEMRKIVNDLNKNLGY